MTLQVPHFQLSSSPTFVNFGQMSDFLKNRIIFEKNMKILVFSPQNSLKIQEGWLATNHNKIFQKSQFFNFYHFCSFFEKKPKISNLSRDKVPKFQNNVILNIKNALTGSKKIKTIEKKGTQRNPKWMLFNFEKIVRSKWPPHRCSRVKKYGY